MAFGSRQAFDQEETELFLNLPNRAMPLLYRLKGPSRPVPVVEDVSVPPEVLPDFLVRTQNVLKRRQVTASLLCHAGHGQIHIQPFLDLDDANDVQRMRLMAEELYEEVFSVGGTIGGERAYGLSRTQFLRRQAGPLYEVLRQVKQILDPENILNPGKIVSDDDELMTRNLRPPIVVLGWTSECGRLPQTDSEVHPTTGSEAQPLLARAACEATDRGKADTAEPCRAAGQLGPAAGGRSHGRLQPLRRMPRTIVADADVSYLPPPARRKRPRPAPRRT